MQFTNGTGWNLVTIWNKIFETRGNKYNCKLVVGCGKVGDKPMHSFISGYIQWKKMKKYISQIQIDICSKFDQAHISVPDLWERGGLASSWEFASVEQSQLRYW